MSQNNQPIEQLPSRSSKRFLLGIAVVALIAAPILLLWPKQPAAINANDAMNQLGTVSQNNLTAGSTTSTTPANASTAEEKGEVAPTKEKTSLSRSTQERTVLTASGVRKQLIDPMASWTDLPPWPEGLPLYAEVETASTRFVNLRPDVVGEMPRILADATEQILIKISIPEADPGEKIYVELPNGGRFTDSDRIGRIYYLDENRTLSLDYITDESRGHCNVKFLHRGNTRSLPIWVGKLE